MTDIHLLHELRKKLGSVIVGQEGLLDRLVIALLAGGHVLPEGPPGLAKTTVVHAEGLTAALKPEQILQLRQQVNDVFIEERIERFAIELVIATRNLADYRSKIRYFST